MRSWLPALLLCGAVALNSRTSFADAPAPSLSRALSDLSDGGARFLQSSGVGTASGRAQILVRVSDPTEARALGLIPVSNSWAVSTSQPDTWATLAGHSSVRSLHFSPARQPLLEVAAETIQSTEAREDHGLEGEGAIVGVVDTGGDATHPALQNADGTTRIAWFLAFGKEPRGVHAELEEEYGCNDEDSPCAIYSRDDINEILESRIWADLPQDSIGHGTHISSLAAGSYEKTTGVAPGADLIIVAAAGATGGVSDARILLGTRFVFDRAEEMNQPAVVNVSLGSSFGAHDGTSAVEQGLAELAEGEGRAVVVASGNSGEIFGGITDDYPEPLGIHTEVTVPIETTVRVPILTSPGAESETNGSIFIWISTFEGDDLSTAFHNGRGQETAFVDSGTSGGLESKDLGDNDDYSVVILNGVDEELDADVFPGSIVVAITGTWRSGRTFELMFRGKGTARIWVTGTGTAGAAGGGLGPLLPRALAHGTVAVPGSQPDLISVGATLNRSNWVDYSGTEVGYEADSRGVSHFSAAGPNQLGDIKPDLVAPGTGVIGAMASAADPRSGGNPFSQFASSGACPGESECFVIDDERGIASGTSMAAPLVAGAVALLMQRDPKLTMAQAKSYLMAGSEHVDINELGTTGGAGELNVVGALLAQERDLAETSTSAHAGSSRVVWSEAFVRPSPAPELQGYLLVRDEDDIATEVDLSAIDVEVEGPGSVELEERGIGLALMKLRADEGSEGNSLSVRVLLNGDEVSHHTVKIARDPHLATYGYELHGGVCSYSAASRHASSLHHSWPGSGWLVLLALSAFSVRRRRLRRLRA